MKARLVETSDPAWSDLLSRAPHDAYHLPGYSRVAATTDGGRASALIVSDGTRSLLLPLLIRDIAGGGIDATSPYGYPGLVVDAPAAERDAFVAAAIATGRDALRDAGIVSAFVRLHPLLDATFDTRGVGTLVAHGETVYVDLTRDDETLWRDTQSGHRNEINRSLRAGHRFEMDATFAHAAEFGRIYRETMSRVDAASYYHFDDGYVASLRDAVGPHLHLGLVHVGDDVAAGALFFETSGIVQYHLSGADGRYVRERPTKLLLHGVRAWAKARGNRVLHLGGGVGGHADNLFKFKAGFSPLRSVFRTWRLVVDRARYDALCDARGVDGRDDAGFFPAYRRP